MSSKSGNIKSHKKSISTVSTVSTVSSTISSSSSKSKSKTKSGFDDISMADDSKVKLPSEDSKELSINHPLLVSFRQYLKTIESLPRHLIIHPIYIQLSGYRDCIVKGMCEDKHCPDSVKENEEFYNWSNWMNATSSLTKSFWTPNKFKEAALKRYVVIADNYLGQIGRPRSITESKS